MEQKYEYVPGLLAVKMNFSAVSSTFDLKLWLSLTTLCGISSPFVQVISVPAFTVRVVGVKLKLSILTSTAGGPAAIDFSSVGNVAKAKTIAVAAPRIHPLLLI